MKENLHQNWIEFHDLDGDGWQDILLVNSKDWAPKGRKSLSALYRNNKNGTFTDVTAQRAAEQQLRFLTERDELTGALVAARYRLEGLLPGGADSTSVFAAIDTRRYRFSGRGL